ncbi:unnamed protein product [Owenia fusiformis]|nr:unnamed protein product [Owenia fusiformis]
MDAKNLLKKFHELQEERVEAYRLFEEGFQAYIKCAPNYNFPMYRQLVHEITQGFKKISEEIVKIQQDFVELQSMPNVATFIEKIQEDEKQKLELTVKLQLATQNSIDHSDTQSYKEECEDLKQSMKETIEQINEHIEELKYETEDLFSQDT